MNKRDEELNVLRNSGQEGMRKLVTRLTTEDRTVDRKFVQHYRIKETILRSYEQQQMLDVIALVSHTSQSLAWPQ